MTRVATLSVRILVRPRHLSTGEPSLVCRQSTCERNIATFFALICFHKTCFFNEFLMYPIMFYWLPVTRYLTRAPLGYFYNAPHWGGAISSPPSDLRNYWTDSKNSSGIWKPWKNCRGKTNFIDLGVTSDVTGQVKVKMFDISGLVTSASKIAMLSTNKAN